MPGTQQGPRPRFRHAAVVLFLTGAIAQAASADIIYADGFEGFALLGGSISGTAWTDPDGDGDPTDGQPLAGKTIYLDADYDGVFDEGEPTVITASDGFYRFVGVPAGVHHVRQVLEPPAVQTLPAPGPLPDHDRLPDEVVSYTHAAPGVGNFDVPYGKQASDWPGEWAQVDTVGAERVDSVDLVLKPIGVRDRAAGGTGTRGTELLTLPQNAQITLRFEEPIVDGPGPDLVLVSYGAGASDEQIDVRLGATLDALDPAGVFDENNGTLSIDLADAGLTGPIHYMRVTALDNGGTWFGFELVGIEVLNFATPDPGAHIVVVTPEEFVFEDRDFARFARDLPPTLVLGVTDNNPDTPELRTGESVQVETYVRDDVGIASLTLEVDGQSVSLDDDGAANVNLDRAGLLVLEATAVDTAGQPTTRTTTYVIANADGSSPFDPSTTGVATADASDAPSVRIVSPAAGASLADDVDVVASITGNPEPVDWVLEYAPVDLVDPYDLNAPDPDYIELASGSGSVYSDVVGTVPLSSLPDDIYFLRLSASSDGTTYRYFGQVLARNIPKTDLLPEVVIDAPATGDHVPLTADVVGTIQSTRALREWFVEYAPASEVDLRNISSDAPNWIRIGEDTVEVPVSDVLANFDGTLLENGSYVVRVIAFNDIGMGSVEGVLLEVTGDAKLGRNRLVYTDIEIELAGFPIRLERVYDSLKADEEGDLGFGWSLGLADAEVGETVPDTGVGGVFGATPFRVGTRVYLNAPDGRRLGFTFNPQPGPPSGLGTPYRAVFDPDPGVVYRLEVPEGDLAFLNLRPDGTVYLFGFAFPYNPERYVLIAPDGKRYTIHEEYGLIGAEDPNGNTLSIDASGIRHSNGVGLEFVRDGQGRISEVRDPEGNAWLYTYDANGDLAAFTDPDGNTTIYTYLSDPAHYLSTIEDPQGRMPRQYEYDPDTGRLRAIVDADGNRQEVLFDPQGFTGSRTDARGNVTIVDYDQRGNVVRIEDPEGNESFYEYNDSAHPDRATRFIDNSGETWETSYDAQGRPIRLESPLAFLANQSINVQYDAFGNITEYNDYNARISRYAYDGNGNRTEEEPFDGVRSEFDVGPRGQPLTRRLSSSFEVRYGYDVNGYLGSQTNSLGYELSLDNRANGRLATRIDDRGELDVTFSPGGLLNTQTDALGNTVTLVQNADGSLTRTDRTGHASTIDYDADRRPITLEQPDGTVVTTSYDPDGNPETVTDPLGNTVTYAFDSTNALTAITDALGNADQFQVDANGNVIEAIDRNGKRRTFEWDANRRLLAERWHDSGGAVIREIAFTYASNRGLSRVDDTFGGQTHSLVYSGRLPRPTQVEYVLPGQTAWKLLYTWNDEVTHPVTVRVRGDGVANLARIRANIYGGLVYGIDWLHPGVNGQEVRIFRDPDGAVRGIERDTTADNNANLLTAIERDSLGRVVRIVHTDPLGVAVHPDADWSYSRDAEGRLLTEAADSNTVSFSYDTNGQLLSATHTNPAYADEDYTYDAAGNRLTSHFAPGPATVAAANRVTAAGDFSYEYDNAGNVARRTDTASGRVTEFAYDHRNRLVLATTHPSLGDPADNTLEFEYDYRDRLLYRIVNGVRTWILHDHDQPIAEVADGAATPNRVYLYDPSALDDVHAVWNDTTGTRWLLRDQLGSVRGIADDSGLVTDWMNYDAFGNLQTGSTSAADVRLGFASRPWLSEIGLYDNRRRFYDPTLGRFIQEDPTRHGGRDFNFYRYAYNAPTNHIDPTGEVSLATVLEIIDAVVQIYIDSQTLGTPCSIAGAVAAGFGYFIPVADILEDPSVARTMPSIESAPLLELTGCNTQ